MLGGPGRGALGRSRRGRLGLARIGGCRTGNRRTGRALPVRRRRVLPAAAAARTCMPAALPLAPFPPEAFAAGAFPRAFAAGALPTGAAAGWANSKRPISGPYFLASLA